MTEAVYCDHCEEIKQKDQTTKVEIRIHRLSGDEFNLDLCQNCLDDFERWVYGKLDTRTEKVVCPVCEKGESSPCENCGNKWDFDEGVLK